jgi:hypothetical protein
VGSKQQKVENHCAGLLVLNVNHELERIWKEAVRAYFVLPFQHEKHHKQPQDGWPLSQDLNLGPPEHKADVQYLFTVFSLHIGLRI